MAVVSTGLSEAGLKGAFFARFGQTLTYWQDLCTRAMSTRDHERYRFLGTLPQLREWVDGRLAKGLLSEKYDITNLKYESTIEVDRDEMDDDQTGQITMRIAEMAESAATHKDYLLELLIKNGEQAGFNSYDGVPFFSEAHESGKSGAQSNLIEAAAADEDVPTTAEFRAAIAKAIAKMVGYLDDQAQPIRIPPSPAGFRVIVPPATMFTAMEALGLPLAPSAISPLAQNILQNVGQVFTFPGLTTVNEFYLAKVDAAIRPFIFQDRMPIEFGSQGPGSPEEFKREKYLYGVRARYAIAYGRWYYCVKVKFAEPG